MKITKWTLRQRKWSTVWWCAGLAAYIALVLAFYPAIRNQTGQLDKSFAQIPQSAKALFTDTQDLFSPVGYLSSQVFYLILPLLLSVLAIGLGSSLIAKEEDSATIELLLSRPVSRAKLLLQKAFAGLLILLSVSVCSFAVTALLCRVVGLHVGIVALGLACLYSFMIAAVFGAVALMVASIGRAGRLASVGVAAMVGLLSYLVASLDSVVTWLKWPAKLVPNHYYHPSDILQGHYTWWPLAGYGIAICVLAIIAVIGFARRDVG